MNHSVQIIPWLRLWLAFIPVLLVIWLLFKWTREGRASIHAMARMLAQLMLVGYFLAFVFESDQPWIVTGVVAMMAVASSWIALRTVRSGRRRLFGPALAAIILAGLVTLALISQGVLVLRPWYLPRYLIPRAGMILSGAMNAVSLAAERLDAEMTRGLDYKPARAIAFKASLIPITNSLFAVGLVALPGMMTGQILSGVSPLIAARYQIMVMCMIFGAAGISSAVFLTLAKNRFEELRD